MTSVMAGCRGPMHSRTTMPIDAMPSTAVAQPPPEAAPAPAFETLDQLVDHLLDTHHVFTKAAIARLPPLADQVLAAHGARHTELEQVARLVDDLVADLRPHLLKEEMVLFPYIRSLAEDARAGQPAPRAPFGTLDSPIACMLAEHDRVAEILDELRLRTGGYGPPPDACGSFRALYAELAELEADLRQHIHLENDVLFPGARALERSAGR